MHIGMHLVFFGKAGVTIKLGYRLLMRFSYYSQSLVQVRGAI
jgi:hypothetical protein